MRVLVGYEKSGIVRKAFRARGYDAWSCDLEPADDGSPCHLQCDIWDVVKDPQWDLLILHPMCTYLTVSAAWAYGDGPYHQKVKPGTLVGAARRQARSEAIENFKRLDALPTPKVIENPGASFITKAHRPPTDRVQPYEFGDDASKITGLWMSHHFQPLFRDPGKRVLGRKVEWPRGSGKVVERWGNQTDSGQNALTPSDKRWRDRSNTYPGIAAALAEQLPNQLRRTKR